MNLTSVLKWVATVLTLSGAACTSVAIDPLNIWLLNSGSVLYLIWAYRINDKALMMLHTGLLSIYAIGGLIRLFV